MKIAKEMQVLLETPPMFTALTMKILLNVIYSSVYTDL